MSVIDDPDDWIRFHLCECPQWSGVTRLGVAVSGGGDSMALLHVLADCAPAHGVMLEAATVDHGLRSGSAEEAAFVKKACEEIDCHHETLRWDDWDGRGNLQAEARAARYRLLAAWARWRGLDRVVLGHTRDDQAETFLMRIAREAGVDGLAAMDELFERSGAVFWRPALALGRAELRAWLRRRGLGWREDPSNEDAGFDRVKARRTLEALAPLGIDAGTLRAVAINLASARDVLASATEDAARRTAHGEAGDVVFDRLGLLAEPWEIRRRLVAAALTWVATTDYPPRRDALVDLGMALMRGEPRTLHGCLITVDDKSVRVAREYNAVRAATAAPGALWDNRWHLAGPFRAGQQIRALGEAVKDCPDWRNAGLPRSSLLATPAVWAGDTLIAAPIAGFSGGFSAEIAHPRGDFGTSVLTH